MRAVNSKIELVVIVWFALVLIAWSSDVFPADVWRSDDTARESVFLVFLAADWRQTRTIAKNPDRWGETNPILGDHPEPRDVDRYFAVVGLAHVGIAMMLPHRWREAWQYVWIGTEANAVWHNYRIGIRLDM